MHTKPGGVSPNRPADIATRIHTGYRRSACIMRSKSTRKYVATIVLFGFIVQGIMLLESVVRPNVTYDCGGGFAEHVAIADVGEGDVPDQTTHTKLQTPRTMLSSWKQEQQLRLQHLRRMCETTVSNYSGQLEDRFIRNNFILDTKNKIILCDLPKVGSTFLKQILHITSGRKKTNDPFSISGNAAHLLGFKTLNDFSFDKAQNLLLNSKKIMFVRHPSGRMLSGYVDKLFTVNEVFWASIGRPIIKQIRNNPSQKSLRCGHDVTFPEFVRYVLLGEKTNTGRNAHWLPMYDSCRPCSIPFDYVGKMEDFKSDVVNIFTDLGLASSVKLTSMNDKNDLDAVELTIERALRVLDKKNPAFECLTLPDALSRAWRVLQIRGVISKNAIFPNHWKTIKSISVRESIAEINNTISKHVLTEDDKQKLRTDAIEGAFKSLPNDILAEMKRIFLPDFVLFGYDLHVRGLNNSGQRFWDPLKPL